MRNNTFLSGVILGVVAGAAVYHIVALSSHKEWTKLISCSEQESLRSVSANSPATSPHPTASTDSPQPAAANPFPAPALSPALEGAPTSYFGGRPLCKTKFVRTSFSQQSIFQSEGQLQSWLLHWEDRLETSLNHHPHVLRPGNQPLVDPIEEAHRKAMDGMKKYYQKQYKTKHKLNHLNYKLALPPVGPVCNTRIQMFGPTDDKDVQKAVCWSDKSLFSNDDCDVISIGSNNRWETEVDIHKRTRCRIHTFDCTSGDSRPSKIQDRTTFYKLCIGTNTTGKFVNWPSMLKKIGTSKPPTYLKMDIEGWEWGVIRSMMNSNAELLPEMIAMEFHTKADASSGGTGIPWMIRFKEAPEITGFALMMYQKGYRLIHVDWDTICSHCLEVLWARIFC